MTGDYKITLVERMEDAEEMLRWLSNPRPFLGVDTETEGLVYGRDRVKLAQFGDKSQSWSIPFERSGWGGLVQEIFSRYEDKYVFHNAKFDISRLEHEGVKAPKWSLINDTHVMSFLHDNEEPNRKLKRLAKKYLGIDAERGERELHDFMRKMGYDWRTIPVDTPVYWQYGGLDASLTSMLGEKLWQQAQYYPEAYDVEMAAVKVLKTMEYNGFAVDMEYTLKTLDMLREEQDQLVYTAHDPKTNNRNQQFLKSTDIRPNFTEDIISYFTQNHVPVPVKRSKKTGKIKVDDEVLSQIDHPIALEIRRARKLKSWINNYLEKLVENEWNGRVHPHINPLGSDDKGRTGRMSITDPALSVLEKSSLIRDCIVAGPDNKLLAIDYSNEELRIIASLCRSKGMIEAFERNEDMHKTTASVMYGVTTQQVTPQQKTNAKRAMFTKAYGGREKTFAAYMGLTFEEGKRYYDTLSVLYPELDEYIESQKQTISENKQDGYGHIFLSDGRKLNIPANISFKAVSYSSQGEAAIVLKKKLVQLEAAGFGPYLRLPVHDEVILEIPAAEADVISKEAAEIMRCTDYIVPLEVETELMDRWGDSYRDADGVEDDSPHPFEERAA